MVLTCNNQLVVFGDDVIVLISFCTPVCATVLGFHVINPVVINRTLTNAFNYESH